MSQTTTAPTAEPKTRGFKAPCPKCGEEGVHVNLSCLNELRCGQCEAEFALADVRALVASWSAVLRWIDLAPTLED